MHSEGSAVADATPAISVSPAARAVPADPPETAVDVAAAVRDGAAEPEQIVAAALERIRGGDPKINAFTVVRAERAVAEARTVAEHPELDALPLAGVPIAIKNDIDVAGELTRGGSLAGGESPAATDHPVVRRLRAAGAVVVGLTELCEFGLFGTTDSPARITRSPWDIRYSAGGSSGGAAAAVAAGLVPVAHGNDGLGSIRIPAACCGVLGVKPGRGVAPAEVGLDSWGGMTENGVFATTVADAALMLSVLADRPALADLEPPAGLRIALATGSPSRLLRVDEQWVRAASDAALSAGAAGHTVQEVRLPYSGAALAIALRWVGNAARETAAIPHPERLQRRTRTHAKLGRAVLRAGLIRPGQVDRIESRLLDFFDQHDVVITPTLACPPPRAHAWHRRGWLRNTLASVRFSPFTPLWNLVGWPALSIPMGLHPRTGTPVAAQLAGPPGSESTLLRLAAQLEAERPWQRIAP
ncbi:amidase [Nocardia macrotermitis]|uniref:amidase n=1 Tax=Nocardia macrotermitis TaxID=2585198 RepID=A0A7K0CWW9_9NOCA|nr:amidase family protein [Nocardia macrotermitis]MQY17996.1 putative amidase AmiB2 [Nocardia macrotermitis]